MMEFCTNCVMPNTRPDLKFDSNGVCDACRSFEKKHGRHAIGSIDWDQRKLEFEQLLSKYSYNDSNWDCVLPVSGGKDSHLSLYYATKVYGLKPLCVCWEPTMPTEIGRENLANISKLGVDLIHFKENPVVYKKLIMEGFRRVGDMEWANHQGIWTFPLQVAIAFKIPMIFWGESPQMEYGGAETISEVNKKQFDEDWLNDYGCLNGLRPQDMISDESGITLKNLKPYIYPSKEEVEAWGGVGVFLGYYFKWNDPSNLSVIENIGFKRRKGRIEVSYTDFEKLDCLSMNLHDYLKFLKYGYGRATDSACIDIRNGLISREEAVRLVERYDGRHPKEAIELFCEEFGITREEFTDLSDEFTNRSIFVRSNRQFKRDLDGSLILKEELLQKRKNPLMGLNEPSL